MTRPSNRFLLGGILLAVASLAVAIFLSHFSDMIWKRTPETTGPQSHIFFDQDSPVVAYQLKRLSNIQLVGVERDTGDPKYRPAYEELLTRDGLASKYRHEAISALAKLNESDVITEILAGIERAGGELGPLQNELSHMLLRQEPAELARARDHLETIAAGSEVSSARTASYGALIMSLSADQVWQHARNGDKGVYDLLQALPMVPDAKRRDVFYPKVEPLLHLEDAAELRRAAIEVLPFFTGHDQESFKTLAGFIRIKVERSAAVRSIHQIPRQHWAEGEIAPLAEAIVTYATQSPVSERTSAPFLDAVQLGNELAEILDAEHGRRIRRTLDDLGVTMILIRTLPDQMLYDKRRIVIEKGKRIEIILENQDFMPHNMVLTIPGAREEIGRAADMMPAQPDSQGRYYVPASRKVLQATGLLEPGEKQKLSFVAPSVPGDYPYLCTFTGHWRRMFGYLVVVEDLEEYLKNPPPPTNKLEYTEWTLDDLAADVAHIEAGRSVQGQEVFNTATCAKCHRVGQVGSDFCPDLSDIFERRNNSGMEVLREILEPSHTIDEKYLNYLLRLNDGTIATGIITAEDANSVTVQSGADIGFARTIDKRDIFQREKRAVSIMPVGLLDTLKKEEIVDLIAFLKYGASFQSP